MRIETYDLIVLGGGSAAALASRAGREGWKTALVEPGPLGGTCPNRGCIPSKFLLQHATVAENVRAAARFHIRCPIQGIDSSAILADVRRRVKGTHEKILATLGRRVTLHAGRGEFLDARTVRVGARVLRAPRMVIATGTRPERPPGIDPRVIPYLVSDDVFALRRAPRSMVIVGGGFIACEFAHFFSALGTKVILVVRGRSLLGEEDGDVRRVLESALAARVDLRLRTTVAGLRYSAGRHRLRLAGAGEVTAETLLYAVGRKPNTDGMGLEKAGLALDPGGFVRVDDRLRTSVRGIYALGDVNGRDPYTHAATAQRKYLEERFFEGRRTPLDHGPMPHAVFTEPEIGSVGETEESLKGRGARYVKALFRYDEAPKGAAMKEHGGLVKLLAGPRGEILGFHAVGPHASVLLHQVVPVMRWRNRVSSLTDAVTVHPSLSEVVSRAAQRLREKLK